MSLWEAFLIGIGLSMDALAVAVCKGLDSKRTNCTRSLVIALFFGGFQALMPLIGYLLGQQFERYIVSVDHWIAFGLLAFLGGKTIYDSLSCKNGDQKAPSCAILNLKELTILSITTSIDALAVGITFAFLQVSIVPVVSIIGITTFVISFCGVYIGAYFGDKFEKSANLIGGAILLFIGTKILLEHLGILVF